VLFWVLSLLPVYDKINHQKGGETMYCFYITYDDGKFIECDNITSVSYSGFDHQVVVQGDEVGSHRYPLKKDLWLHADSGMWCVRGDGVRSIQVCKT